MAHTDDGFHEIQLNGKQLVFLFMAATVVSVVIFLCGVLVGRGVRAERGAEAGAAVAAAELVPPTPEIATTPTPTPTGSDPTAAAAPQPVDELSYFDRLQTTTPPAEQLKPPAKPAAPPPAPKPAAPAAKPAPAAQRPAASSGAPPPVKTAPRTAPTAEPTGPGFVVQIAALNVRSEADAIAKRLASKGYAAYVTSPATGTPQIFRVRIGKFGSRREAETVAAKLEKEEQFKPWITR